MTICFVYGTAAYIYVTITAILLGNKNSMTTNVVGFDSSTDGFGYEKLKQPMSWSDLKIIPMISLSN